MGLEKSYPEKVQLIEWLCRGLTLKDISDNYGYSMASLTHVLDELKANKNEILTVAWNILTQK